MFSLVSAAQIEDRHHEGRRAGRQESGLQRAGQVDVPALMVGGFAGRRDLSREYLTDEYLTEKRGVT